MADKYTYKVRDRAGKVLEGSIEADSTKLVAERLRSMGYVPIAIDRKSTTGMKKELHIPGLGNRLKIKIKSAMTYPIAVLGLVLLILTAMLIFVVPMFKHLYDSLGGKLPPPTRLLLFVSSTFVKLFPVVIIVDVAAVVGFKKWIQT